MANELQTAHISAVQRRIHWATFIAVSVVFVAALVHDSVDSGSARGLSLSLHELFGLAVLLLAVIRLFLVATGRRSSVIRGLAPRAGHTLLYLALLYQPMIGIFTAQATGGKALKLFSWQLPQWLPADEDFATAMLDLHEWIAWAFLALILGHIAMAIWHVVVTGDKHSREMFQEPEPDNERQTS